MMPSEHQNSKTKPLYVRNSGLSWGQYRALVTGRGQNGKTAKTNPLGGVRNLMPGMKNGKTNPLFGG
jgi:hypothetical protein